MAPMGKKISAALAVLTALMLPAVSLGGTGSEGREETRGKLGQLVAKDKAKQHPEAAVARAELSDFGKVTWSIATQPAGLPVEYAWIVRCEKGWLFDYYPGPGDVKTTKKKAPFKGTYNIPLADPDSCNFQVAGLIPGESEKRGRVFTKIYNKG
jgi:hypothetical protein